MWVLAAGAEVSQNALSGSQGPVMPESIRSGHLSATQLAAFARGEVAGADRAAFQVHLAGCEACRAAVAALQGGAGSLSPHETLPTCGRAKDVAPSPLSASFARPADCAAPADLANH